MRQNIHLLLTCLLFVIPIFAIGQVHKTDKKIDKLISAYTGLSENYTGDWPDVSLSAIDSRAIKVKDIYQKLLKIKVKPNSVQDKINYDLLKIVLQDEIAEYDYGYHFMTLNAEGGFMANIIYSLSNSDVTDSASLQTYLNKLRSFENYLNGVTLLMNKGIETAKVSPKIVTLKCIDLLKYHLGNDISMSVFAKPIDESMLTPQVKDSLEVLAYQPYKSMLEYLSGPYLSASASAPGISELPGGRAFYEHKVRFYTTLDMTPDQVFEKGQQEVKRIRIEMDEIINELEFKGSFPDFLTFLRTDPKFYAETPQQLLHYAAWVSKSIESHLPKYFNTLPRNPYTVSPVPDALAPNYTGGRYSEGSYARRKAGAYWVNTYNLKSRPLYVIPALTLHEAVPGHHLQITLSQEIQGLSAFRQNTYLSAFGEGWALYTEYLGKEMGIYTTPYENFGRLTYEMWRACRLVVDVGLHYKGWTRDQAVDFMANNTALSMHEVNTEIDRYIGWPAQAVSYKIGELTIREMRAELEKRMGSKFNLAVFHDNLLKNGSMTLSTLRPLIMGN